MEYPINDVDLRKEIIEELKIVQDILLKQEAYSLGALRQAYIIMAALVIAYISEKTHIPDILFLIISELVILAFIYIQLTYRDAFYDALDRSHLLQKCLGGRLTENEVSNFKYFEIFESIVNEPKPKITLLKDKNNPRFYVPNGILLLVPIFIIIFYHNPHATQQHEHSTFLIINSLGLLMDIIGIILVWKFGLPVSINREDKAYILQEKTDEKQIVKAKLYDKYSYIGLGLLVVGFFLQFLNSIVSLV